jgi:hypothetical protein
MSRSTAAPSSKVVEIMNNSRIIGVLPSLNTKNYSGHRGQDDQLLVSPAAIRPSSASGAPASNNKSNILWRDFFNGIRRRRRLLSHLKDQAGTMGVSDIVIKQQMLELRQMTLSLIEDALEIEFRGKMIVNNSEKVLVTSSFQEIDEKHELKALAEIISDTDDLLKFPIVRAFLPVDFPKTRNPFLFGKSVDHLVDIIAPHPEMGNTAEELKVLELMRFKRASKGQG